jgi:hypothetical protein
MSLRRVDTTFDLPEAHIIVGLLRSEGIDAHLFDADFVRQNWFKAIAYGGYRILVPDEAASSAREITRAYREMKPALSHPDDKPCPSCASTAYRDDPRPRRWVFFIYILQQFVMLGLLALGRTAERAVATALVAIVVDVVLAMTAIVYLKRRYLCDQCGNRWREPHRYISPGLGSADAAAFDRSG